MKSETRVIERDRALWCYSFKASKLWLDALQTDRGSRHTIREYCRGLKAFCDWIGKNPDQLIAERKAELKDSETEMNAENKLREFCVFLENEGKVSRTTIATKYHAVVKSFYRYNNLPLKLGTPKHTTVEREPHTMEEIKKLLQHVDAREKYFLMQLKDSGMSREDAVTVTYGNIKAEYESGKEVIHLRVVRQKESIQYDTFIGKNAIETLKAYLEERQRKGEKITDNTPLMATLNGEPLTPEALSAIFSRLSVKVGFKTSPHRFRKFFESHLGLSAPSFLVKHWMGHSLGVERSYFLPPVENQRQKYEEAYKEIDLSEKSALSELDLAKATALGVLKGKLSEEDYETLKPLILNAKSTKEVNDIEARGKVQLEPFEREDCQLIISENELEDHIKRGFRFVAVLPSGKIVVSNET
jgi:site-specific recombinase XerD